MSQILLVNAHASAKTATAQDAKWEESKHKRDKDGKFSTTGGKGSAKAGKTSSAKTSSKVSGGNATKARVKYGLEVPHWHNLMEDFFDKQKEFGPTSRQANAAYKKMDAALKEYNTLGKGENKGLVRDDGVVTAKGMKAFKNLCSAATRKFGLRGKYDFGLNERHGNMYVPKSKAKEFQDMADKRGIKVVWTDNTYGGKSIRFSMKGQKYDWYSMRQGR